MSDPRSPQYKDIVSYGVPTPSAPPRPLSFPEQIGIAGFTVAGATYLTSRYNGVSNRESLLSALLVGGAHYIAHNIAAKLQEKDDILRNIPI